MNAWDTPRGRLSRIGEYDLGRTIGRGAYAHVREATHRETRQVLACKILPALHIPGVPLTRDKTLDACEAYKEIVLLKAFGGAGISGVVQLDGMMEEDGWTYVFMKCYEGDLSKNRDTVKGAAVIPFFRALLRTVESLHLLGVSHEDIKRGNILFFKESGKVLPILADFGFSQFLPKGGKVKSFGGTVDYSSPEKVADLRYDPFASEVWSLGIILCKLFRYPHPYVKGDRCTSEELKQNILYGKPTWHWSQEHLREGGIAEVIRGMLHRDPDSRWTDVLTHPLFLDPHDLPAYDIRVNSRTRLDWNIKKPVSHNVLMDVCFLAQQAGRFRIPQNPQTLEQKIYGRHPHWQQRWASMLTKYELNREVKDWVDMFPPVIDEGHGSGLPRNRRKIGLREIHLTPMNRTVLKPSRILDNNKENELPKTLKVVGVGHGNGAAVGAEVHRTVGPQALGYRRGRDIKALSTAPAEARGETDTPNKPPPLKGKRRLGKPVRMLPVDESETTVPKRTKDATSQKLKAPTIKAPQNTTQARRT